MGNPLTAIGKMMITLRDAVFPLYDNWRVNKKLREKLKNEEGILPYIENADRVTTEQLKKEYDNAIWTKDKLEDKAKTNVAGITIAVTLIMGASGLLDTVIKKYPIPELQWTSFVLLLLSIAYLIIAGILSIRVLVAENVFYTVDLSCIADGGESLKKAYDKRVGQNKNQNLIRNNNIYSSYECIRNALICLFAIFLLTSIPVAPGADETNWRINDSPYTFVYSAETIPKLEDGISQRAVEETILYAMENYISEDTVDVIGIIDDKQNLFIEFSLANETILVKMIESYVTP
jgi:hypothetical protein